MVYRSRKYTLRFTSTREHIYMFSINVPPEEDNIKGYVEFIYLQESRETDTFFLIGAI